MCIFTTLECFSEVKSWSKSFIQYHSFNESICKERNIKGFSMHNTNSNNNYSPSLPWHYDLYLLHNNNLYWFGLCGSGQPLARYQDFLEFFVQ